MAGIVGTFGLAAGSYLVGEYMGRQGSRGKRAKEAATTSTQTDGGSRGSFAARETAAGSSPAAREAGAETAATAAYIDGSAEEAGQHESCAEKSQGINVSNASCDHRHRRSSFYLLDRRPAQEA